ncbi:FAD/NAD(P)-binding domain-containing protein [Zalerion maritima]|uniref:FAD/NAD(P)-binding domain-containing protein n=1 Tax=Zalerion maritima TaxID=339359 RepID=A0AAD5RNZ3_9PEZI|nr:FAD/NAD(P)-binding domain-containing protein [Zalerion maritima]
MSTIITTSNSGLELSDSDAEDGNGGNPALPPRPSVAVVGGGIAGTTVAGVLGLLDMDVIIFEANPVKPGGRMSHVVPPDPTNSFEAKVTVDLGPNRLYTARDANISTRLIEERAYIEGSAVPIPDPTSVRLVRQNGEHINLDSAAQSANWAKSMKEILDHTWPSKSGQYASQPKQTIQEFVEQQCKNSAEPPLYGESQAILGGYYGRRQGADWAATNLVDIESIMNPLGDAFLRQGTAPLFDHHKNTCTECLVIWMLGHEVNEIIANEDSETAPTVTVKCSRNNYSGRFDAVVVCIPVPVLQRQREMFKPGLPSPYQEAFESFEGSYAHDLGIPTVMTNYAAPTFEKPVPVLVFEFWGPHFQKLKDQVGPEQGKQNVMDFLKQYYRTLPGWDDIGHGEAPVYSHFTNFSGTDATGNCSFVAPKSGMLFSEIRSHCKLLYDGIPNRRIWFAGDAAVQCLYQVGTFTGAQFSGRVAAERICAEMMHVFGNWRLRTGHLYWDLSEHGKIWPSNTIVKHWHQGLPPSPAEFVVQGLHPWGAAAPPNATPDYELEGYTGDLWRDPAQNKDEIATLLRDITTNHKRVSLVGADSSLDQFGSPGKGDVVWTVPMEKKIERHEEV